MKNAKMIKDVAEIEYKNMQAVESTQCNKDIFEALVFEEADTQEIATNLGMDEELIKAAVNHVFRGMEGVIPVAGLTSTKNPQRFVHAYMFVSGMMLQAAMTQREFEMWLDSAIN